MCLVYWSIQNLALLYPGERVPGYLLLSLDLDLCQGLVQVLKVQSARRHA